MTQAVSAVRVCSSLMCSQVIVMVHLGAHVHSNSALLCKVLVSPRKALQVLPVLLQARCDICSLGRVVDLANQNRGLL